MLRLFFVEGDSNFASGLALPRRSGFRLFRASMRFVVQDELGHKHMLGNKGAAGSICCSKCANVMNIDPARVRHRTDVHHYGLALPKDFSLHTDASAWAVVDHIGAQRLVLSDSEMGKCEQRLGCWAWAEHISEPTSPLLDHKRMLQVELLLWHEYISDCAGSWGRWIKKAHARDK